MLLSTEEHPVRTTATVKPHKYGPCMTFSISGERLLELLGDVSDPHLFEYVTLVALHRRARMAQFNPLQYDASKEIDKEEDPEDETAWAMNMLKGAKKKTRRRGRAEWEINNRRRKLEKIRTATESARAKKTAAVRQEAMHESRLFMRRMKAELLRDARERAFLGTANLPGLAGTTMRVD